MYSPHFYSTTQVWFPLQLWRPTFPFVVRYLVIEALLRPKNGDREGSIACMPGRVCGLWYWELVLVVDRKKKKRKKKRKKKKTYARKYTAVCFSLMYWVLSLVLGFDIISNWCCVLGRFDLLLFPRTTGWALGFWGDLLQCEICALVSVAALLHCPLTCEKYAAVPVVTHSVTQTMEAAAAAVVECFCIFSFETV